MRIDCIFCKTILLASVLLFLTACESGNDTNNQEDIFTGSGIAAISKTGQKTCYDQDGVQIDCLGTGQDGEIQAGIDWPIPKFTDNNDGTITDNLTGLMWLKNANCIATFYPSFDTAILDGNIADGGVTWQLALDFITGINSQQFPNCSSGYSDWHLPSITELQSIFDYSKFDPALPSDQIFSNLEDYWYWSSTTEPSDKTFAVSAAMNGSIGGIPKDGSWTRGYVIPVRITNNNLIIPNSGQNDCFSENGIQIDCTGTGQDGEIRAGISWPPVRFTDNSDGTITDNLTNLMWLKDANCMATNYPEFDVDEFDGNLSQGNVTWEKSLQFVKGINEGLYSDCSAVYTDWHLPNVKEMHSLANSSATNLISWLTDQGFINVPLGFYATSTTYAHPLNLYHSWFFNTFRGGIGNGNKIGFTTYFVLPVRIANK